MFRDLQACRQGRTGGTGGEGRDERGLDPVSYTHLRAHETVLDLVCRLLLEKKKNSTRDIHSTQSIENVIRNTALRLALTITKTM